MPSITADISDLAALTGCSPSKEQMEMALLRLGAELKSVDPKGEAMIDVLANRPDMYSVEGIARAVAPFLDEKKGGLRQYPVEKTGVVLAVEPGMESVRPYISCAVVRGVRMDDKLIKSLMDIQEKLHLTVGRKRAKVSIGVHDSVLLVPPFRYEAVDPAKTRFVPLAMEEEMSMLEMLQRHPKGIDYAWILQGKDKFPLITDAKRQVLSFPPIINGTITTVTPATTDLFIDITGTDRTAIATALGVLCASLADRGGKIGSVTVKYKGSGAEETAPDFSPSRRTVDARYINGVLGTDATREEIVRALGLLGHGTAAGNTTEEISVAVPAYRSDILHPVDIAEDAGFGLGFGIIEPTLPESATFGSFLPVERFSRRLGEAMAGLGFNETYTLSVTSENEQFAKMGLRETGRARISNPLNAEQTMLRVSLVPSLMRVLSENKHHDLPQRLYEIADVVLLEDAGTVPGMEPSGGEVKAHSARNRRRLAFAVMNSKIGFTDAKSIVQSVYTFVHEEFAVIPKEHGSFIDGRCASIVHYGKEAGYFGEIHPSVLVNFGLDHPVVAGEIDVDILMRDKPE